MYTVLYRKKRPAVFGDIVGQDAIITTLRKQLCSGNVSHAYLFCGTRGTGKTSSARVFARALNCSEGQEGDPCNDCQSCKDILAERSLNVIEIDAASNNGVDNIRDLREEVKYPPASGSHKIYIIDEAHMLTTAAFNALLKTLEEPPDHIIFILATTDPQKIPATILSRCQRYDFKRINRHVMVSTLADYMQAEGVQVETEALEYIASVSDGAMRDALSILGQCLSLYTDEAITLTKVQSLLGAVDQSALFAYTKALQQQNTPEALAILAQASKEGRDLSRFTADIITHLRNILVAAQTTNPDILDYSPETISQFQSQGQSFPPAQLISYIQEFSSLQNQMRYLPHELLALEVCTIKLSSSSSKSSTSSWGSAPNPAGGLPPDPFIEVGSTGRLPLLSSGGGGGDDGGGLVDSVDIVPSVAGSAVAPSTDVPAASSSSFDWASFCATQSMLLKPILSLCSAELNSGAVTITARDPASLKFLNDHKSQISSDLLSHFGLPNDANIVFLAGEGYNDDTRDAFKENIRSQINMPVDFE